jgi:hypothetical protein
MKKMQTRQICLNLRVNFKVNVLIHRRNGNVIEASIDTCFKEILQIKIAMARHRDKKDHILILKLVSIRKRRMRRWVKLQEGQNLFAQFFQNRSNNYNLVITLFSICAGKTKLTLLWVVHPR